MRSASAGSREGVERLLVAALTRGMTRRVRVCFCCNDECGNFTGRTTGITFNFARNVDLDLVSTEGERAFTVDHEHSWFRACRLRIGFLGYHGNFGTLLWDAFLVDRVDAMRLIHLLARRSEWECEGGLVRVVNWWDRLCASYGYDTL